jgi:hypothetical protein
VDITEADTMAARIMGADMPTADTGADTEVTDEVFTAEEDSVC